MKVETKELDGLLRELSVQVPSEQINNDMEQGYSVKQAETTLKGYRKGKAPLDMIKSHFREDVMRDVTDKILRSTLPEAVEESALKIASTPTLVKLDFDEQGNMHYVVNVEIFPEFDKVNLDKLQMSSVEIDVTDQEAETVIEQYRKQLSELRVVTREATATDVIVADMKKITDPQMAIDQEHFPDAVIDLASEATVKEFKEQLPGMKVDDEKTIDVQYDVENPNSKLAGAKVTYGCKIKEVKERILPEISDAFAKSTGRAETLLELKLKIREDVKAHKSQELKRLQRRELIQNVCEQNQIPIPNGMVDKYLNAVIEDMRKQNSEVNEEEIRKQYRPMGVDSMRWEILWHRMADEGKIEVLPSDTEKWIETFSASNNMTKDQATEMLRKSGRIDSLRESIREEKVIDYLMGNAKTVKLAKK